MAAKRQCTCRALSAMDPNRPGVPAVLVTGGRSPVCPVHKTSVPTAEQARIEWAQRIARGET